jgi:hypothetical protein
VADFDEVIPPGQEGKVNIKIVGKKLGYAGSFTKKFTVRTNDPDNAQFILVVHGTVIKAFQFSGEMRWSGFLKDKMIFENVITNMLSTPVNITGVRWGDDGKAKGLDEKIGLKIKTVEQGVKYRLTMWNKKELPPGGFTAEIILVTDHPKIGEKAVAMTVIVQKEVEIHPERIYTQEMVVPAGYMKAFDNTFDIVAARGDSLKILKAVPNRGDMTVKIEEIERGKLFRGTITVRPKSTMVQYLGSVKVYTNYPGYRELTVDLEGGVRQADR